MNTPYEQKSFVKKLLAGYVPVLILIGSMFYVSYENNRIKELIYDWIWLPSFIISTFILTIAWLLITTFRKLQNLEKTNEDKFFIVQFFFIFVCFYPINHWVTNLLKGVIDKW